VTRYLKSVYAAVAADIGTSLVSRQPGDRPRKVTRELAAKRPVPVLSPPGTLPAIRGRQVADGKPIRRAGPPAARAPEAARQQRRSSMWERYGEQRTVRGQGRPASSPYLCAGSGLARGRCGGDMSTPQKCPPTRHYLQTTSDNRRYGRFATPERSPVEVRGSDRSVLSDVAGWRRSVTVTAG
jgi:hypothetical protein